MATRRKAKPKPKPPVPGNPPGIIRRYELIRTLSTFIHSTGAVAITILATLATTDNMGSLWRTETVAGTIGVMAMTVFRLITQLRSDNTNKAA